MTVFVTGGAGFIGCNFILKWFKETNEPVVNLDKLSNPNNIYNLDFIPKRRNHEFIHGDILDTQLVSQLIKRNTPRAIIHFAAESHVDKSIEGPLEFLENNVVGTVRLLDVVRSYWGSLPASEKKLFRFVHISTDEVYGALEPSDPSFTELNRYSPSSPYSASKASSDHFVHAYNHTYGVPTLITNCSNNYGPLQYPEKLIPLVIMNALKNKELPIYGDGKQIRDWLHVTDHCNAVRYILDQGAVGQSYNIGASSELSNIELVHMVCSFLDKKKPRADKQSYSALIKHVEDRPGHDRRYAIDYTKLEKSLTWKPSVELKSGIEKTVDWYLCNEDWIQNITGANNEVGRANTHDNITFRG